MLQPSHIKSAPDWDLELVPNTGYFNFHLKEIWHYRYLISLFIKRDFAAQYKQTVLGPVWHLIQPIFTTLAFLLLFTKIARIPTNDIPPPLFYLSGISLWNYFSGCLLATSNTFVANAGIFGKVYFPRLVIPVSVVLSNMIKFGIQFSLLLLVMLVYRFNHFAISINVYWLLIPLLVLMMAALSLGIGIVISSLTIKYRDLGLLMGFVVQLLLFVTPIAYPISFLKNKSYAEWIAWNPLTPMIEAFRYALFQKGNIDSTGLLYSALAILCQLAVGIVLFSKVEKTFIDAV